jgi:hypothetical protein
MKKLFFIAMLLVLAISVPIPTIAQVSVQIGIPLPPPIAIPAPPEVVLLPNTGVYVAPDLAVDLFFFDGWWWRPWEGRWYRSRDYRRGWGYYNGVPSFYGRVPGRWRDEYREHHWNGREWNYQRVTHPELHQIHQRNVREQSRVQPQVRPQQARPQQSQAARPQQVRPQQQRSAPQHSEAPHGGGGAGAGGGAHSGGGGHGGGGGGK